MEIKLMSHPNTAQPSAPISVVAFLNRCNTKVMIEYVLTGDMKEFSIPAVSLNPSRVDGLWCHTCFEAFMRFEDSEAYYELNASPTDDWNLYSSSGYHQDRIADDRINYIFQESHFSEGIYRKVIHVDFANIFPADLNKLDLHMGITAVLEDRNQNLSYWAHTHCDTRPNFHMLESFSLQL